LIHTCKGIVAILPDLAAHIAVVDRDVLVPSRAKRGCLAIVDSEGNILSADP
jgi:hypothetical protein